MIVYNAKQVAHDWIVKKKDGMPGFHGAFYHGSINWLSDNDFFPAGSDVDVIVVAEEPVERTAGKFIYGDLILDISYLSIQQLGSSEQILGNYYLAGSFRKPSIILDPDGRLRGVQQKVSEGFAKRYWVQQRCRHAASRVLRFLEQFEEADLFPDQVSCWLFAKAVLTHILLTAGLKNPTVRQRYLSVQKLLKEYHHLNFYETLLDSLGCADMGPNRVEQHLQSLTEVFDTAKSVIRTGYLFASDISDTARPITIDGTRKLVADGYCREAVFWITATYSRCMHVLYNDEPEAYRKYSPAYEELLRDLRGSSIEQLRRDNERTRALLPVVLDMAETIVNENPEVGDEAD